MAGPLAVVASVVAIVAALRSVWSPCGLSMLSSINPMTEQGRGHRYPVTAAWFVAGSTLGGAAVGGAAAILAWLLSLVSVPPAVACWVGAMAALACLAADRRWFGFVLPDHPRQVDETWLRRYRRWVYAAGFGVQIGSGFATYIMTAGVYFTAVAATLTGDPLLALLVWVVFGLTRGLAVLMCASARSPERLAMIHARLARLAGWSADAAAAALAWAAFSLAGAAVGWRWPGAAGAVLAAGAAVLAWPRRPPSDGPAVAANAEPAAHSVETGR